MMQRNLSRGGRAAGYAHGMARMTIEARRAAVASRRILNGG
jgi:hypothetical protein